MNTSLHCEEVSQDMMIWGDGEIEGRYGDAIAAHMEGCAACGAAWQEAQALRRAIARSSAGVYASSALRSRVSACCDQQIRGEWSRKMPMALAAAILFAFVWRGLLLHSAAATDAVRLHQGNLPMDIIGDMTGNSTGYNTGYNTGYKTGGMTGFSTGAAIGDIRESREKGLRGAEGHKVVGANLAGIQNYLSQHLPFHVQLKEGLFPLGLPALGGRVTQIDNREAAYIRYRVQGRPVSMFVYQHRRTVQSRLAGAREYWVRGTAVRVRRTNGYTVANWRLGGLHYRLVSELPEEVLVGVLSHNLTKREQRRYP